MTDRLTPDLLTDEAIAWLVRVNDAGFAEWEAFTDWLEASPAHAAAYHAAASAEAEMTQALAAAPPQTVSAAIDAPRTRRSRQWLGWAGAAMAASLVGVMITHVWPVAPSAQLYRTAPGTQRTIALADGSQLVLNGASGVSVDGSDPRSLTMLRGEALFTVRHDQNRPFRIRVGNADIVDVGTRFSVVREGGATRIAVAQGAIDWHDGASTVRVDAGHQLRALDGASNVVLSEVSPDTVGGWTHGQLDYDGAPLGDVAADMARSLGVEVTVDPALTGRTVHGVLRLEGGASVVVPRLAAVVGVRARRDGARWRLLASP